MVVLVWLAKQIPGLVDAEKKREGNRNTRTMLYAQRRISMYYRIYLIAVMACKQEPLRTKPEGRYKNANKNVSAGACSENKKDMEGRT